MLVILLIFLKNLGGQMPTLPTQFHGPWMHDIQYCVSSFQYRSIGACSILCILYMNKIQTLLHNHLFSYLRLTSKLPGVLEFMHIVAYAQSLFFMYSWYSILWGPLSIGILDYVQSFIFHACTEFEFFYSLCMHISDWLLN